MEESNQKNITYLLLTKDDLPSYSWLLPCKNAGSDAATTGISKWISIFGSTDWLVTNQGPHFTETLMRNLTNNARLRHHLTTYYCPWDNGTIKRLCKEVIQLFNALLSDNFHSDNNLMHCYRNGNYQYCHGRQWLR